MQATFRFLTPNTDGTVIDIDIKANDLDEAFNKFMTEQPNVTQDFAVWRGRILCARVLHEWDSVNKEMRPTIIEFNPVEPTLSNPFACGD